MLKVADLVSLKRKWTGPKSNFLSFIEKEKEVDQFVQDCDVSRLMQDLIGNYIMMEEYFMREMVLKVIAFCCGTHRKLLN